MSDLPHALPLFVDRVEELARLGKAMEEAKGGKGQLMLIRGEAGVGKTRLVQEAISEAKRRGFAVALGTAYSESLKPYHPWRDLLRGLGLSHLLEEHPPPKLLALYAWTGESLVPAERVVGDTDRVALQAMRTEFGGLVRKSSVPAESVRSEGRLSWIDHGPHQLFIQRGEDCCVGAVVQGKADEVFFSDLRGLADMIAPGSGGREQSAEASAGSHPSVSALLGEILESGKYEGIDYVRNDPKLRQARLFENVSLGLTRTAELRPVFAVLDDLQWADPSSLALLHYAARNTRGSNVLLLGAYRMEEGGVRPHLRDALQRIAQEELFSELSIEGLRREDLDRLVESFEGPCAFPASFLDLLWRETQGNPLFVREVLRGLEEDGALQVQGGAKRLVRPVEQLALSRRVRDVIRARLVRLSKEDRGLLDAAAACGTRFTAALVAGVAREGEGRVLRGLNSIARVHGLLRPVGEEFVFNHALVHEVVYEDMPEEARRSYHREAAEWLELAGGLLEDFAEHYYLAGDPRAAPILWEAARGAAGHFANAEAIRFYGEALELESAQAGRLELLQELGDVQQLIGDLAASLETYRAALALAPDSRARSRFVAEIGMVYIVMGSLDEAFRAASEAWSLVKGAGGREESRALRLLGLAHHHLGRTEPALECMNRGVEIAEQEGDDGEVAGGLNLLGNIYADIGNRDEALPAYQKSLRIKEKLADGADERDRDVPALRKGVAGTLNNIGVCYMEASDYERALEYLSRALTMSQANGDLQFQAQHLNNLGDTYWNKGDFDKALDYQQRALELSKKIGAKQLIANHISGIGDVLFSKGLRQQALRNYQQALDISLRIGDQRLAATHLRGVGLVYASEGDFDRATEHLERSLTLAKEVVDAMRIAKAEASIGAVHKEQGDFDAALRHLEEGLRVAHDAGSRDTECEVLQELAEVSLKKGNMEEALEFGNRAMALVEDVGARPLIARARRVLGTIHRERGEWEKAAADFEECIKTQKELGVLPDLGESHFQYALLLQRTVDSKKANEHLDEAERTFERIASPRGVAKVRDARARLGRPRPVEDV